MVLSLQSYLAVSTALFALGVFGLLTRRNIVAILISIELILNSASLNFVAFNRFSDQVNRLELRFDAFMEEFSTFLQRHASAPRGTAP